MSTSPYLGDSRKITELGNVLNASKLPHGYTGEIPYAPLDAHQGNIEQTDTMGLPLPLGNAPLDPPGIVNGA